MKYTQEQKDVMLIAVCLMSAWLAFGLFVFGDMAVLMTGVLLIGYAFGRIK